MKLQVIKKADLDKPVRATIQMSGRLGFTTEAAAKLDLSEGKYILFSQDNDEKPNGKVVLYMSILNEPNEDAFKVSKAGDYFYLSAKDLFDNFKFQYQKKSIALDLTKEVVDGNIYYKCVQREDKHKMKEIEYSTA